MKSPRPPATPDPNVVSAAQTRSNRETAAYQNAIEHGNINTPLGSQTFTGRVDPTTGAMVYDTNVTLDPKQQALLDLQNAQDLQLGQTTQNMLGQVDQAYAAPLDVSTLGPAGANDAARQQIQDALYQRETSYLDPQWQQREQSVRTRLANQGIVEGSEAWRNAIDEENRARSFDYSRAREGAIIGGGDEQSRLAGIRGQLLEQLIAQRSQPMNEFNALRSATQVNVPSFQQPGNAQVLPTDVAGNIWNAYGGQMNQYNARMNSRNSLLSGLMNLGGSAASAAILASDARVKSNARRIGLLPTGVGVYEFEYKGDPQHEKQVGVMAQEVEKVDPAAVLTGADGIKRVDYARVMLDAMLEAA